MPRPSVAVCVLRSRTAGTCSPALPRAAARVLRSSRTATRVPLSRCVGPKALAGKNRTACIPF